MRKGKPLADALFLGLTCLMIACSQEAMSEKSLLQEYREVLHFGELEDDVYWSPDGTRVASISDVNSGRTQIWDATTGALQVHLENSHLYQVAWSQDGRNIAGNTTNDEIHIWNTETGEIVENIPGLDSDFTPLMRAIDWNPAGDRIATSADFEVILWDLDRQQLLDTSLGHSDIITSVAWSPDGAQLASCGADGEVRIWDANTWENAMTIDGWSVVAWSPDGARVATSGRDNSILVWNVETGEKLNTLKGHAGNVLSISWSLDGTRLASSGTDRIALVWDPVTGEILTSVEGQKGTPNSIAWSPTDNSLATVDQNGTIQIWEQ